MHATLHLATVVPQADQSWRNGKSRPVTSPQQLHGDPHHTGGGQPAVDGVRNDSLRGVLVTPRKGAGAGERGAGSRELQLEGQRGFYGSQLPVSWSGGLRECGGRGVDSARWPSVCSARIGALPHTFAYAGPPTLPQIRAAQQGEGACPSRPGCPSGSTTCSARRLRTNSWTGSTR